MKDGLLGFTRVYHGILLALQERCVTYARVGKLSTHAVPLFMNLTQQWWQKHLGVKFTELPLKLVRFFINNYCEWRNLSIMYPHPTTRL